MQLALGMIGKMSTDGVPETFCQTLASIFILSPARRSPWPRLWHQGLTSMNVANPVRFKTFLIGSGTLISFKRSLRFCSAFAAISKARRPALLIYETFARSSSTPPGEVSVARNKACCSSGAVLLSTAPTTERTVVDCDCCWVISSSFISRPLLIMELGFLNDSLRNLTAMALDLQFFSPLLMFQSILGREG